MTPPSGASAIEEEIAERRVKVLTLRNAGGTFAQIAAKLGVSVPTVRKDLTRAYRDVLNATPEEMLARQRSILFDITRANYTLAMQGDRDAAVLIMRALEQEAKLFGLNAPARVLAGVSDVEFAEQAAALIESLTELDPNALKELERARDHHTHAGRVIDAEVTEPVVLGRETDPAAAGNTDGGRAGGNVPAAPPEAETDAVPERDTPDPDDDEEWSNL